MEKIPVLAIISFSSSADDHFQKIQYMYGPPTVINNTRWSMSVGGMKFYTHSVEQVMDIALLDTEKIHYIVVLRPIDGKNTAFSKDEMKAKLVESDWTQLGYVYEHS